MNQNLAQEQADNNDQSSKLLQLLLSDHNVQNSLSVEADYNIDMDPQPPLHHSSIAPILTDTTPAHLSVQTIRLSGYDQGQPDSNLSQAALDQVESD
eukprot:CAMPEP_0116897844 /NCGR_PEP_ID=MMETSP0467-20121206/6711_1 /TAXON_ID=283647 /ORGANISM="Mesodinium pulex, Strain SPMC105" /LENGTH=96 /DNA_ID=CAMNT_0004569667 /DNA_START=120 /DNA_END=410 /DNA_ORIENTATION=+